VTGLCEATVGIELQRNADGQPTSLLRSDQVNALVLRTAADEVEDFELGIDLSSENDPPSSRAHAYWRRPQDPGGTSIGTIDVACESGSVP
jgi:hypothetical protein